MDHPPASQKRTYYHVVWSTHNRAQALLPEVQAYFLQMVREFAAERSLTILEASCMPDHVHLLLEKAPWEDLVQIMEEIKGRTSRLIALRFPELKADMGPHFWEEGYHYEKHTDATLEKARRYVRHQQRVAR